MQAPLQTHQEMICVCLSHTRRRCTDCADVDAYHFSRLFFILTPEKLELEGQQIKLIVISHLCVCCIVHQLTANISVTSLQFPDYPFHEGNELRRIQHLIAITGADRQLARHPCLDYSLSSFNNNRLSAYTSCHASSS